MSQGADCREWSPERAYNPACKGDGRGITITYHPDALHRITSKSYSDGEQTI